MANLAQAVKDFYGTLSAGLFPNSTRPDLVQTSAPQTRATGEQLDVARGYVTFAIVAANEEQGFEGDIETLTLTFTAFALGADKVGQIISAIRFNGQPPAAAGGFDNRPTLATLTDGALIGIFPSKPPESSQERGLDKSGLPVFRAVMTYRVLIER